MENKELEPMRLVFTSFRDSMSLAGMKVSMDRHLPRFCSYPVVPFLVMPLVSSRLSDANMEKICRTVLDNNWELVKDFIEDMRELGIKQIVVCDWATAEQIVGGKFCPAGIVARYIAGKIRMSEFEFPVEIEMRDGRETL